ncbi:MAG: gliding motility-associated C-terminal domain-containing protein, partial [Saprospiraceae bacterium]|nr:gliding motility-associated C-terminal domain-containing protein [Saprospiraceae bacterium]
NLLEDTVLNDLIDGENPGGTWSESSTNPTTGGQFDPTAGAFSNFDLTPGIYQFTYTVDGEAPCPARTSNVQIGILDLPSVNAGVESPYYLDCNETTVSIGDANNPTGTNYLYEWTDANSMVLGTDAFLDAPGEGTYTLFITDTLTGCVNSDTTNVVERVTTPVPEISIAPISCFGDNDGIIQINSVSGGMGPFLYSLNGAALTGQTDYSNLPPAQYTLTVEDAYGCQNTITINIEQPENLLVDLVVYVDAQGTITLGDSVELNAFVNLDPSDIDSVNWSPPGMFNTCDTCLRQVVTPLENTNFSVTVISNDGCMASDDFNLRVRKEHPVYIPSGFSPNNDGVNDFFLIYPSPALTEVKSFLVFDRWGEVVHEYYNFDPNNTAHGWDGTFRGQPLNPGVFTYFAEIEFVDGVVEIFKGDVTIVK